MSLKVSEKVVIVRGENALRHGKILDYKWNMVLVKFAEGDQDWVEIKNVKRDSSTP